MRKPGGTALATIIASALAVGAASYFVMRRVGRADVDGVPLETLLIALAGAAATVAVAFLAWRVLRNRAG